MDITKLIESGQNISVTVTAKDLKQFADTIITEACSKLERSLVEDRTESLMTIDQVAVKLGVSRMTLYRWDKSNYLRTIEVGGEKRYRLSDINKIIKQNETL